MGASGHPTISIPDPGRFSKLFFSSRFFEIVKIVDKSIILIYNEVGILGNAFILFEDVIIINM